MNVMQLSAIDNFSTLSYTCQSDMFVNEHATIVFELKCLWQQRRRQRFRHCYGFSVIHKVKYCNKRCCQSSSNIHLRVYFLCISVTKFITILVAKLILAYYENIQILFYTANQSHSVNLQGVNHDYGSIAQWNVFWNTCVKRSFLISRYF